MHSSEHQQAMPSVVGCDVSAQMPEHASGWISRIRNSAGTRAGAVVILAASAGVLSGSSAPNYPASMAGEMAASEEMASSDVGEFVAHTLYAAKYGTASDRDMGAAEETLNAAEGIDPTIGAKARDVISDVRAKQTIRKIMGGYSADDLKKSGY